VNAAKQKRTAKAALGYLNSAKSLPSRDMECIFDVVAVTFDAERADVEWIPQAYIPLYI
jgi:Holliday junction resolvase-like predicted endonuclease